MVYYPQIGGRFYQSNSNISKEKVSYIYINFYVFTMIMIELDYFSYTYHNTSYSTTKILSIITLPYMIFALLDFLI